MGGPGPGGFDFAAMTNWVVVGCPILAVLCRGRDTTKRFFQIFGSLSSSTGSRRWSIRRTTPRNKATMLYRLTQKTYPDTTNVEYAYDLASKVLQGGS